MRLRGLRPRVHTAALIRPKARAASTSQEVGSNSLSVRCSTSVRFARSAPSCVQVLRQSDVGQIRGGK